MSEEEQASMLAEPKRRATTPRDKHATKQNYLTPDDLRAAVIARFGPIVFDLAAADGDEIIPHVAHFTPEQDALKQEWPTSRCPSGVLWLNPPFKDIYPWSAKCAEWRLRGVPGSVLALLTPLSADTLWWRDHVRGKAHVIALASRPKFKGEKDGYPKPTSLAIFDPRYPVTFGESLWDWRGTSPCSCEEIRAGDSARHFKGCPARKEKKP